MDSGFFGIGISELFWIAIIALVVLGPGRLPGAMREATKVLRYARAITRELSSQYGEEMKALEDINPQSLLKELTQGLDGDDLRNTGRAAAKPSSTKVGAAKTTTTAMAARAATRPPSKTAAEEDEAAAETAAASADRATAQE